MSKAEMISEILLACKTNNVLDIEVVFFTLAFRTESELRQICRELYINVDRS